MYTCTVILIVELEVWKAGKKDNGLGGWGEARGCLAKLCVISLFFISGLWPLSVFVNHDTLLLLYLCVCVCASFGTFFLLLSNGLAFVLLLHGRSCDSVCVHGTVYFCLVIYNLNLYGVAVNTKFIHFCGSCAALCAVLSKSVQTLFCLCGHARCVCQM